MLMNSKKGISSKQDLSSFFLISDSFDAQPGINMTDALYLMIVDLQCLTISPNKCCQLFSTNRSFLLLF